MKVLLPSRNIDPVRRDEFLFETSLSQRTSAIANVCRFQASGEVTGFDVLGDGLITPPIPYTVFDLHHSNVDVALLSCSSGVGFAARLAVVVDIIDAISGLHNADIVHRDLKLENILISQSSQNAILTDFGRADDFESAVQPPFKFGDPRFAPPDLLFLRETADAEVHFASEIYLVGSLIFESFTSLAYTPLVVGNPRQLTDEAAMLNPADRGPLLFQHMGSWNRRHLQLMSLLRTHAAWRPGFFDCLTTLLSPAANARFKPVAGGSAPELRLQRSLAWARDRICGWIDALGGRPESLEDIRVGGVMLLPVADEDRADPPLVSRARSLQMRYSRCAAMNIRLAQTAMCWSNFDLAVEAGGRSKLISCRCPQDLLLIAAESVLSSSKL